MRGALDLPGLSLASIDNTLGTVYNTKASITLAKQQEEENPNELLISIIEDLLASPDSSEIKDQLINKYDT